MANHEDLHQLFKQFDELTVGNAAKRNALRRFLTSMPENQPVSSLFPLDEMEERLQHVRKLEMYWNQNFERLTSEGRDAYTPFSDIQVAALVNMDMFSLRAGTIAPGYANALLANLMQLPCFTKICNSPSCRNNVSRCLTMRL